MPRSEAELQECIQRTQRLIRNKTRRMGKLEDREALEGIGVDPSVSIEIEDLKEDIAGLKAELHAYRTELKAIKKSGGVAILEMFTNRDDEIKLILSSFAPACFLLDAPPGYGKTELLQTLKQRFVEQNWLCAFATAQTHDTLAELAPKLASELEINLPTGHHHTPWGVRFGGALALRWPAVKSEGVALLIDLNGPPALQLLEKLLNEFIPQIKANLNPLPLFKSKNRFRVIIAGRYLAGRPETKTPPNLRPKSLALSPFEYTVIRDFVAKHMPEQDDDSVSLLAAHLMYLTGGHPGCMAQSMQLYRQVSITPDAFFQYYAPTIWADVVNPTIQTVLAELPQVDQEFISVLDKLAVFRYLDYSILNQVVKHHKLPYGDVYRLADKLTAMYIYNFRNRLFQDDIIRRLLAIRQWQPWLWPNENKPLFFDHCRTARDICHQRFKEPPVERSETWAIEYLYQSLQQHAGAIGDQDKRRQICLRFMAEVVPQALRIFIDERGIQADAIEQEKQALLEVLEKDWEFQFTVNYFLRADQFNSEPFEQLVVTIQDYFAGQKPGGSHG